ncbi:DUF3027 domain-containing protein [Microbacterium proteolyticum]|uniref:DUF3027 domain-containing protein n=1 Tax=Microbacterium proteolyticum TaxID=1572644 RepID=UPI0035BFC288
MTSKPEPVADERLLHAHDLALAALSEITPADTVGPAAGHIVEDDGVVSLRFHTPLPGYPGWHWTVSVAVVEDAEPTVLEAELLPGDGALLAPDWVPWAKRLAEYQAAQLAAAEDESDDDIDDDLDGDDESDEDADDDDEDDEPKARLHAGDLDGVDIDELDEDSGDDDADSYSDEDSGDDDSDDDSDDEGSDDEDDDDSDDDDSDDSDDDDADDDDERERSY